MGSIPSPSAFIHTTNKVANIPEGSILCVEERVICMRSSGNNVSMPASPVKRIYFAHVRIPQRKYKKLQVKGIYCIASIQSKAAFREACSFACRLSGPIPCAKRVSSTTIQMSI